jgi:hypothetical protein
MKILWVFGVVSPTLPTWRIRLGLLFQNKKIGYKTRFIYFGGAICAIHELMTYAICCCSGKMLKHFSKFCDKIKRNTTGLLHETNLATKRF